ncbi:MULTISPECIES: hypothetical protein [Pseudomonas]|nr:MULTISPECIES: hypothetical protein [Pseudomonas]VCU63586.1 Hypothetical new protein [Pseudomonas synxantha]
MRNTQTREGFEFWDKLNALPRYAFLLSPSGKSVQKFEDQAMGNWVDVHEAQKVVDQAQEAISELRDEIATSPKPDPVLCKFYDVTDWPGLVRELVGHVAQLQESAKRNVKPWEDTFPPTLLPAYIERVNAENSAAHTDRSPEAYAIEHAEYMAKSADGVLAKFQAYGLALLAVDEGGDDGEGELLENIDSTRGDLQESLVDLRSMVYEFRKRAAKSRQE